MEQYWLEYFAHPLAPVLTITLAVLALLFLQRTLERLSPGALQTKLGAENFNVFWFWIGCCFWAVLFLLLFGGLVWTVVDIVTALIPSEGQNGQVWTWRFSVLKLASLTAVLGAVVALPFTLIRLNLTNTQVETAYEALTNNKMDIAVADLHAQRQITRWDNDIASNGWEDDITRRNGAIDRLLGLVEENADLRPRVDRLLTVYLRELTREFPADSVPEDASPEETRKWANGLTAKRSDMENAVQVLSRLPRPAWKQGDDRLPDLQGINMQAFNLSGLHLDHADLREAQLQGADLSWARLQEADLDGAEFDDSTSFSTAMPAWAALKDVDLSQVPQIAEHLKSMFGDGSVILPKGVEPPDHWPKADLGWNEFEPKWREWQRAGGFDPDTPQ